MAAQKNTGMVITLACSMLLSVVLAVVTWMTVRSNSDLSTKLTNLETKSNKESSELRDHIAQLENLKKAMIGSSEKPTDSLLTEVAETVKSTSGDGTEGNAALESALKKTAVERDSQKSSADDRMKQLELKTQELQQTIVRKDGEIKSHQDAAAQANESLRKSEARHSELLSGMKSQIDELIAARNDLQEKFNTLETQARRREEDLLSDLSDQRNTIKSIRARLFEKEDTSFDRADGLVQLVDLDAEKCYINIGTNDNLEVGRTFSVYTKSNNGVGRRNTEDIKGKIEIVNVMGPYLSEARITRQDLKRPIAVDDPIYSPLFSAGVPLRIAVAGNVDFDGNPGSDSEEFIRIAERSGATIAIRTSPKGELLDSKGNPMTADDLKGSFNEQLRFLVIADTGENSETRDPSLMEDYKRIRDQADEMRRLADQYGVYVINLSSFLDFIGYTRKLASWVPREPFPAVLPNGAKSATVEGRGGLGLRKSSAAISGAFSGRRKAVQPSVGHTSKLFRTTQP